MKKFAAVITVIMLLLITVSASAAHLAYAQGTGKVAMEGRGAAKVAGTGTAVIDTMGNFGYITVKNTDNIVIECKDPHCYVKEHKFGNVTKIYANGIVTITGTDIVVEYKTGSNPGKMTAWGTGFARAHGYGKWKISKIN